MSVSANVQAMIVARLKDYQPLDALIDGRVYDLVPKSPTLPYVSMGPHEIVEDDAECIIAGVHSIQVDVWSEYSAGFLEAKQVGDAVKQALHHYDGTLDFDALVELRVELVRYMRDPDGLTTHGIVTCQALVEEAAAA